MGQLDDVSGTLIVHYLSDGFFTKLQVVNLLLILLQLLNDGEIGHTLVVACLVGSRLILEYVFEPGLHVLVHFQKETAGLAGRPRNALFVLLD